jgi:ABC-type multidrug transport system ATPase subunit
MIKCERLTRQFAPEKGIIDFSADFAEGEITCILGKNGSGKTTLLNMISGLNKPDKGSVCFDGKDLWANDNFYHLRKDLSILPTDSYLYPELTIRENLEYISSIKYGDKHHWKKINDTVCAFDMENSLASAVENLSYGLNRKAHLLAALLSERRYIIWDEPHNGIDVMSNQAINDLLTRCKNSGSTVLVTTHIIEITEKIADRVIMIDKARIVKDLYLKDAGREKLYDTFLASVGGCE